MFRIFIVIFSLMSALMSKDVYLQLDTGGHTGQIRDLIVTKEKDIITASTDKTIRVWDSKTGKEKRKILGEIGDDFGDIFSIALSPDEKYLAVGGVFVGSRRFNENPHEELRIYDYKTSKILKVLTRHRDVVADLSFSLDGKYLISGSADSTAKVWRVKDWSLRSSIKSHSKGVYAVDLIRYGKDYLAITAGYDNMLSAYNITERELVDSLPFKYKLDSLAINRIRDEIAVCGFGQGINIFEFSLKPITMLRLKIAPSGLKYSKDGKYLISGSAEKPYSINIFSTRNYSKVTSFKKHTNSVLAVNFLDTKRAVSAGGNDNEIYIWNIKNGKVLKDIRGVGQTIWDVGIKGDKIAWGNKVKEDSKDNNIRADFEKYIDLNSFTIHSISKSKDNFKRISTINGDYSLIEQNEGEDREVTLLIKKGNEVISSITKDGRNGNSHICYGWYKDYIISGGSNGQLRVYNKRGEEIASLVGHTGEIWAIAIEGDRLVSGGSDQTIKIWDLSKVDFSKRIFNEKLIQKYMKEFNLPREDIIQMAQDQGVNLTISKIVKPSLNIFISKEDEWVAWTPKGYYTSSLNGVKYIGFHINQGWNKEAYFVTADKYPELYRPDIINLIIQGYSEEQAIRIASKKRRVESVDIIAQRPPVLNLLSPSNIKTSKNMIEIKFRFDSPTEISKFIIARNGSKISKRSIERAKSAIKKVEVDLEDGENIITVRAKNRFALSDPITIKVFKASKGNTRKRKSNLYLLSVGVSRYKNSNYNLQFADNDAKSIVDIFNSQEKRLYNNIFVKTLLNDKATTSNILKELKWLENSAKQNDTVIIFLAGHGKNDSQGNYYFITHDSYIDKLSKTSLKWTSIKRTIENLKSKVVLFTDTCHSGNVIGGRKQDITGALKSIVESGSEAVIISATSGRGYSIEKPEWRHGAFTKALIEGIGKWKANRNRDKKITVFETNLYLTERVIDLTQDMQKPTISIPYSVTDFPIISK